MRTTITMDDDVAAEVRRLTREEGVGVSEAVNRLVRAGLARPKRDRAYRHRTAKLGMRVAVDDIGAVLELLDES